MAERKRKPRSKGKTTTKKPSRAGAEVLEHARALVLDIEETLDTDPRMKAVLAAARKITPLEAVDALEAWLAERASALRVRRGTAPGAAARLEATYGKLPKLHHLLVERFGGFLELAIDPGHWPHGSHRDGVRVFGVSPDYPECDLATQLPAYESLLAMAEEYGSEQQKKSAGKWRSMVPLLSNLYGVADSWIGAGSAIEWFRFGGILAWPRRYGSFDRDDPMHPRFGAPFAMLVRLRYLDDRLDDIDRMKAVERAASELEPVRFDARGRIELTSDRSITLRFASEKRQKGRPRVRSVVVAAEIGRVPMHAGAIAPLFLKRIEGANQSGRSVKYFESIEQLYGRTDLFHEGLSAAELACAIARVRHAKEAFEASRPFDFDSEPRPIPDAIAELLRAASADAQGFSRVFLTCNRVPKVREVEHIGRAHPRIRWSFSVDNAYFSAFSHAGVPEFWHRTMRPDGARAEAELLCSNLTRERVLALMAKAPIAKRELRWGADMTNDEQAQIQRGVLATTEGTLRGLGVPGADPTARDFWRAVAATAKMTPAKLREVLDSHRSWLRSRSGATHTWTTFSWLSLELAVYRRCESTFAQGDLSLHDLRDVALADVDLTAGKLVHVLASGVDFSRAKLEHVMATSSDFQGARFDGARLSGADFSRSTFKGASFRNADCTGVDFEACDLTGCDFTGARLEGIKTKDAIQPPSAPGISAGAP